MSISGLDRRTLLRTAAAAATLVAAAAAGARAQETKPAPGAGPAKPGASPTTRGGFSPARLKRLHDVMTGHVARGAVAGLVTLVSRRGETHADAIGAMSVGGPPMRRDTIFRIASVTKPFTAAAAMILIEQGKLRLDDAVERWLPELANRKVLKRIDGPLDDTEPAKRAITLRDLLTFRCGIGAVMVFPSRYPIQKRMEELGIAPGPALPNFTSDELMKRFASLPLLHQPGEKWAYHSGSDILGVLIERVSGKRLGAVLSERIFAPLGMKDTGFSVSEAKIARFATQYQADPQGGALKVLDEARGGRFSRPPAADLGGGGLVSTADDLLAFGRLMLNKGSLGQTRILSRLSVELMTADHITPEQKAALPFFPGFWDTRGWGFGLSVITRRENISDVPGRFGWDGGYGTSWYVDPKEELIGILLCQRLWDPRFLALHADFWTAAYQAIDD